MTFAEEYEEIRIPDLDLIDKNPKHLLLAADRLVRLRTEVRMKSTLTDDNLNDQHLIKMLDRDIALYKHFADQSHLDLDHLVEKAMKAPLHDDDAGLLKDDLASDAMQSGPSRTVPESTQPESVLGKSVASHPVSLPMVPRSASKMSNIPRDEIHNSSIFSIPPSTKGMFKWTVLRALSLSKTQLTPSLGRVTCFLVKSIGIIIGTDQSVLIIYDLSQNFLGTLGSRERLDIMGSVTCIDSSPENSQLIAGYSNGYICLWNFQSKTLIKVIEPRIEISTQLDAHRVGIPIVSVRFHDTNKFYAADMEGSTFYHELVNNILYRSVKTIRIHGKLDNDRFILSTSVLSLAPARKCKFKMFSDSYQLVAIISPFKIAIISTKPVAQIQFRATWNQIVENEIDAKMMHGQLKWWIPQSKSENLNIRALAFSFGSNLALLHITYRKYDGDTRRKLLFRIPVKTKVSSPVVAIEWINQNSILCLTSDEYFRVYNPQTLDLIEQVSISHRSIISNPPFTSSKLVQESLKLQTTFYNSVCCYYNRIFVLSKEELCFASVLPWKERLSVLFKAGKFAETFKIGVDMIKGKEVVLCVQLPNLPERVSVISDHLTQLLLNLVSMIGSGYDPQGNEDMGPYYTLTTLVFNTCLEIGNETLIFRDIWDRYMDHVLDIIYLEVLQDFVLQEKITHIPSQILKNMLSLVETSEQKRKLELVLLHLDLDGLDIHDLLQTCWQLGLCNAFIYVSNCGLGDYTTPFFEILKSTLSDPHCHESLQQLYTLFVYLACIFSEKAFPKGTIAPEKSKEASKALLSNLFSQTFMAQKSFNSYGKVDDQVLKIGVEPWPYLEFLLKSDCIEMIKVLNFVLRNPLLKEGFKTDNDLLINQQVVIDILFQLMKSGDWSDLHVDHVYSFICKACHTFKQSIALKDDLVSHILDMLLSSTLDSTLDEREESVNGLFLSGYFATILENEEMDYMKKFKIARFWKMYETFALETFNFEEAIESYLIDSSRKKEIFSGISKWMATISSQQHEPLKNAILKRIDDLVFDGVRLAGLFNQYWPNEHNNIIKLLDNIPANLYIYLEGLLNPSKMHMKVVKDDEQLKKNVQAFPDYFFEKYIRLMFSLYPSLVRPFLDYCDKAYESRPFQISIIEKELDKCKLIDVEIWLNLAKKNYKEALSLIIEQILNCEYLDDLSSKQKITKLTDKATSLCNSKSLWCLLLEKMCFRLMQGAPQVDPFILDICKSCIISAKRYITPPDILILLLNTYGTSSFGSHRYLVKMVLESFSQDTQTLQQTLKLANSGVCDAFTNYVQTLKASISPNLGQCQLCRNYFHLKAMTLSEQKCSLVAFNCKHAFHHTCLSNLMENICAKMNSPIPMDDTDLWCVICGTPSDRKRKGKSPRVYASLPDLRSGTGDSERRLLEKFNTIDHIAYKKVELARHAKLYKSLASEAVVEVEDKIEMNESPIGQDYPSYF